MMVSLPFPVVLALAGALYWPATLTLAVVVAAFGAVLPRKWMRVICFVVAAIMALDCLLALRLERD